MRDFEIFDFMRRGVQWLSANYQAELRRLAETGKAQIENAHLRLTQDVRVEGLTADSQLRLSRGVDADYLTLIQDDKRVSDTPVVVEVFDLWKHIHSNFSKFHAFVGYYGPELAELLMKSETKIMGWQFYAVMSSRVLPKLSVPEVAEQLVKRGCVRTTAADGVHIFDVEIHKIRTRGV